MAEVTVSRRFFKELANLIEHQVKITVVSGKTYSGILRGYDPNTLSVCLVDGQMDDGTSFSKLFLYGHQIASILQTEKPFDLAKLAERLEKLFPPGEVKYIEDARAIIILNKVKVTEHGVEGSGIIADRVRQVYEQFLEEISKKETK